MAENIKIGKLFRFVEKRDSKGRLISLEEVKSTNDPVEIAKLKDEIALNQDIIKREQKFLEDNILKEKENQKYIERYTIEKLLASSIYAILLNKIDINVVTSLVSDIAKVNDVYEKAKLIGNSLKLPKYEVLNEYFKFFYGGK